MSKRAGGHFFISKSVRVKGIIPDFWLSSRGLSEDRRVTAPVSCPEGTLHFPPGKKKGAPESPQKLTLSCDCAIVTAYSESRVLKQPRRMPRPLTDRAKLETALPSVFEKEVS